MAAGRHGLGYLFRIVCIYFHNKINNFGFAGEFRIRNLAKMCAATPCSHVWLFAMREYWLRIGNRFWTFIRSMCSWDIFSIPFSHRKHLYHSSEKNNKFILSDRWTVVQCVQVFLVTIFILHRFCSDSDIGISDIRELNCLHFENFISLSLQLIFQLIP